MPRGKVQAKKIVKTKRKKMRKNWHLPVDKMLDHKMNGALIYASNALITINPSLLLKSVLNSTDSYL